MISNRSNNRGTDIRNNPTANRGLQQVETKYNPIKYSVSDLKSLNILCTNFDKENAIKKVYMIHDERNELYRCPNSHSNNVISENQVRYALRLELPEYIHYDRTRNINEIKKQREEEEKFIIQPINAQSPINLANKVGVRAVKKNDSRTEIKK